MKKTYIDFSESERFSLFRASKIWTISKIIRDLRKMCHRLSKLQVWICLISKFESNSSWNTYQMMLMFRGENRIKMTRKQKKIAEWSIGLGLTSNKRRLRVKISEETTLKQDVSGYGRKRWLFDQFWDKLIGKSVPTQFQMFVFL